MQKKSNSWEQDETGQWWYIFGKRKVRTKAIKRNCLKCGDEYLVIPQRLKQGGSKGMFCSRECGIDTIGGKHIKSGSENHFWKGGRNKIRNGYIEIFIPDHPHARGGKYVREHRLVMEKHLGRYLETYEQVHHRNGIKDDNRIENLELISMRVHLGKVECPHCRKEFSIR